MATTNLNANSASAYTGGSGSPTTHQRTATGAFNPFQSFINIGHTSSPNNTKPYFRSQSTHGMPMDSGAVAQRHQIRAAQSGPRSEISSLNINPVTQPSRASQASPSSMGTRVDGNATKLHLGAHVIREEELWFHAICQNQPFATFNAVEVCTVSFAISFDQQAEEEQQKTRINFTVSFAISFDQQAEEEQQKTRINFTVNFTR
ncbi:hypothetical protein CSHISOI_02599 [Colletotrichum shisoi]|uniref:Uncharacterized protein n=1 Tax=Colletotrichum shisoi TaxID=2078593 RepID=A0A5Q4C2T3_9PEZI|nr:hypothetical protein CSHISOI_02599 [Colletotrichum shisoi]